MLSLRCQKMPHKSTLNRVLLAVLLVSAAHQGLSNEEIGVLPGCIRWIVSLASSSSVGTVRPAYIESKVI